MSLGASQSICADLSPAVAVGAGGADASRNGVTACESVENAPGPASVTARTLNWYDVPAFRFGASHCRTALSVDSHAAAPEAVTTSYFTNVPEPNDDGSSQATRAISLPAIAFT